VQETKLGQVIILNIAPRAGKSSIVTMIQNTYEGPWMNLGVYTYVRHITPVRYRLASVSSLVANDLMSSPSSRYSMLLYTNLLLPKPTDASSTVSDKVL
jgi:chloramphenicol 3-O-phosphotransferase